MIWVSCMRQRSKPWAQPFVDEHRDIVLSEAALLDLFKQQAQPLYLEIGSGKGNFLIEMATRHPEKTFVGIERALPAVAMAGRKLAENPLVNAVFAFSDIGPLLAMLPPVSSAGIFLNFSDPWPKKRHEKRRLTALPFLNEYRRILVPGACLYMKTDNKDFFSWSEKNIVKAGYNILATTDDYGPLDTFDALTEYEVAFRAEGVKIQRLIARKD